MVKACLRGDLNRVVKLLDLGAPVNAKTDVHGVSPLMAAAAGGHIAVMGLLLARGADVNANAAQGITALTVAMSQDQIEAARVLLNSGADANTKDSYNTTPLMAAAMNGQPAFVKMLLESGADVTAKNSQGKSALTLALEKGHKEVAALLESYRHADVSPPRGLSDGGKETRSRQPTTIDKLLRSPPAQQATDTGPIEAAKTGDLSQLTALLAQGADVSVRDKEYGGTPLHWASWAGHSQAVVLLLKHGVDIDSGNKDGNTPLMLASARGKSEVVKLLLENGAAVDTRDSQGSTALILATAMGHREIVELLLANGADAAATDKGGKTAADWAAERNHLDIEQLLRR